MNMDAEYRLLFLDNGKIYISEIELIDEDHYNLKNPMIVEYKYNEENNPIFRYVPWQILSEENVVTIPKSKITMITKPKTEMLDVYQQICIAFVPLEKDDE